MKLFRAVPRWWTRTWWWQASKYRRDYEVLRGAVADVTALALLALPEEQFRQQWAGTDPFADLVLVKRALQKLARESPK